MYRWILCFTLLLTTSLHSKAQSSFKGGLILGINTSQITGDDLAGYNKLSPDLGVFVRRYFGDKFSMQMEMQYLGKGSHKNLNPKDSVPTLYLLRLHYIEVPLMAQYDYNTKLTIEVGPSLGVLFKSREEDLYGPLLGNNSSREQFRPFELSFNVGGTWKFNEKWSINIRSANSVFPVRNHDQKTSYRLNKGQYSSCIMGRILMNF